MGNEIKNSKSNFIVIKLLIPFFFIFLFGVAKANASCSSCNTSNASCTAGTTAAQVNSCLLSTPDGATINFSNGSYNWSSNINLNPRNGVTLICESAGGCDVATSGTLINYTQASEIPVTNLMRISGFNFHGSNPGSGLIWIEGEVEVQKLRIDHNTFTYSAGAVAIMTGHTQSTHHVHGVIDHNTFLGATDYYALMHFGAGDNDWVPGLSGSANNLFFEDNTINFTNDEAVGGRSCSDAWNGGALVMRHNNIHNCRVAVHGSCHGGPANFEVYNNTISTDDAYRLIHHQGSGEFIVFNNILSADSTELLYYRSWDPNPEGCGTCDGSQPEDGNRSPTSTYHGYPCWIQPGRDVNGKMMPIYVWNNRVGTNKADLGVDSDAATYHVKANRDIYQAVSVNAQTSPTSPFNGTSGMGFGTLANRPTTCTTTSETLDAGNGGVGYFATDVGAQGTLYMCSATNIWTAHYTPYTYPHPLQGGGSSDTTAPASPSGLTVW
jgi:hypothetical protein